MIMSHCPRPAAYQGVGADHVVHSGSHGPIAEARIGRLMEVMSEAYAECGKGNIDLTKLPMAKQRQLAHMAETLLAHHKSVRETGNLNQLLSLGEGVRHALDLRETVTSADFATFTTQQLAFIVDVWAPIIFDEVVTTIGMLGPTAFVHSSTYRRASGGGIYGANSALTDGLDPSYSECPAECEASNGIDFEVTSDLVEAECRRLHGEYCLPANYHYSSQYGGNLGEVLMAGIGIELRRAIQGWMLALIYGSAAATYTWNRTPAANSVWENLNTAEWKRELWNTLRGAARDVMAAPTGRVSPNIVLGDIDGLGVLEETVPVQFSDDSPGNLVNARGSEVTGFFGTTKEGRFKLWRFMEGMPQDTLVLLDRNDADPTVVYAPWIPITGLQAHLDPKTAVVTMGAMVLHGQTVTRPSRIRRVNIGA